jgi:hypothetical protein
LARKLDAERNARIIAAGQPRGHMRSAWDSSAPRATTKLQWGNPDHRRNSSVTIYSRV